jgi:dTDP-4-dehydrorhamnose reductase
MDKLVKIKSVIIIGGDSAIGKSLARSFSNDNVDVWTTTRRNKEKTMRCSYLDLKDIDGRLILPTEHFDVAFLCAAVASYQKCQLNPDITRLVNVTQTFKIAEQLTRAGVFVIFLSTNAVFDGVTAFARSTMLVAPNSEYGRQKADAEFELSKLEDNVAIVRFGKILPSDSTLLCNWKSDLLSGKTIHPYIDMFMAPLSMEFAVMVLKVVAAKRKPGIFQATATSDINFFDAATYIANKIHITDDLIRPTYCKVDGISFAPKNTTLDGRAIKCLGINLPSVFEAIDQFI